MNVTDPVTGVLSGGPPVEPVTLDRATIVRACEWRASLCGDLARRWAHGLSGDVINFDPDSRLEMVRTNIKAGKDWLRLADDFRAGRIDFVPDDFKLSSDDIRALFVTYECISSQDIERGPENWPGCNKNV